MKKLSFFLAMMAVVTIALTSCAGDKTGETNISSENEATEQVADNASELDLEGIQVIYNKSGKDVTSADLDFLLEQAEIFADKTKDMTPDEIQKNLSEDETGAVIVIAMALSAAEKNGMLSEKQLKKYKELKEQSK